MSDEENAERFEQNIIELTKQLIAGQKPKPGHYYDSYYNNAGRTIGIKDKDNNILVLDGHGNEFPIKVKNVDPNLARTYKLPINSATATVQSGYWVGETWKPTAESYLIDLDTSTLFGDPNKTMLRDPEEIASEMEE